MLERIEKAIANTFEIVIYTALMSYQNGKWQKKVSNQIKNVNKYFQ